LCYCNPMKAQATQVVAQTVWLLVVVNRMATTSQKSWTGASSRFAGCGCATGVSTRSSRLRIRLPV